MWNWNNHHSYFWQIQTDKSVHTGKEIYAGKLWVTELSDAMREAVQHTKWDAKLNKMPFLTKSSLRCLNLWYQYTERFVTHHTYHCENETVHTTVILSCVEKTQGGEPTRPPRVINMPLNQNLNAEKVKLLNHLDKQKENKEGLTVIVTTMSYAQSASSINLRFLHGRSDWDMYDGQ